MAEPETNRQKYEQWVRTYAPALFRYAYHLTGKRHLAEDLLQETFTEAWKSLDRQKDPTKVRGWLFAILRHRHAHYLRDHQRYRANKPLAESTDADPQDRQPPPLQRLADRDSLQAALEKLSPAIRETFLTVFAEGLTCREASEMLGIPLGTVLSRLDSARRTLRQALSEAPPGANGKAAMHHEGSRTG